MPRAAFSQIVNRSMSEVLTRSLATSFCTLLPVISLLLFGGDDAQGLRLRPDDRDRLGCLLVDLHRLAGPDALEGARARLPHRRARIIRELGRFPPTPPPPGARPRTSSPSRRSRRNRRGRLTAPEDPGQPLSRDEFQDLVRRPRRRCRTEAWRPGAPGQRRGGARARDGRPELDPTADLTPEDLVLKDAPKPKPRRQRNKRHGRAR